MCELQLTVIFWSACLLSFLYIKLPNMGDKGGGEGRGGGICLVQDEEMGG